MQLKLSNGQTRELPVYGATMGLQVKTVTFDLKDVETLLEQPPEIMHKWLSVLSTRFAYEPTSEGA